MTLTVGSLFSGVGGFEQGFQRAGFQTLWQVEIDRDAVSVLEWHWPRVQRYGDIREVDPAQLAPVDVVTFGSPCQGFSVAGRGEGLEDARSGLFGEAIRIICGVRPALAVWENVPGAFSANDGRDFGAVLAALAESGALDIAWRVLDAQWFGVPQRRRRIFLVADFGGERAAQVLFEPEGSRWDSEACRAPWESAPGDAEDGAGSVVSIQYGWRPREYSQGLGIDVDGPCYTLDTLGEHADGVLPKGYAENYHAIREQTISPSVVTEGLRPSQNAGGFLVDGDGTAHAVTCHAARSGDPSTDNHVIANSIAASAGHHDHSSPRGDGSDNLIVAATWDDNQITCADYRGDPNFEGPSHTLHARGLSVLTGPADTVRSHPRPGSNSLGNIVAAPLTSGSHPNSNMPGRRREDDENLVAIPISADTANGRSGDAVSSPRRPGLGIGQDGEASYTLNATQTPAIAHTLSTCSGATEDGTGRGTPLVASHAGMAVRRLTPRECERLMGWPDDWTRYRADGSETPDGARYRMIGNGVVAPVAEWLAQRIRTVLLEGVP